MPAARRLDLPAFVTYTSSMGCPCRCRPVALLPGIKINTGSTDFYPIEQLQLQRFDGKQWVRFGEPIDASRRR
jgi:hypothetical protein